MDVAKNINLSFNEVHIWQVRSFDLNIDYKKYLSARELLRADNFFDQNNKFNFVMHRCAVKKIIAKYVNLPPEEIDFLYNAYGKPYFNHNNLYFNLTHIAEYMLLAITINTEVGIDVEKYENKLNYLDIAKNIFSVNEYNALLESNDNERALKFYRYWTRKEAIIKAAGLGLNSNTRQIDTSASTIQLKGLWHLTEIYPQDGYIATLASRYKFPKIQLFKWI